MPDIIIHNSFGKDIFVIVSRNIQKHIIFPLFELSLNGPDDWAMYRFWIFPFRNGINTRSKIMHYCKCGDFLAELALAARNSSHKDLMFSYLCGFLCHYALDSITHPYINAKAGIYDGTSSTKEYAGNHMALEHTLDIFELEKQQKRISERPITSDLFKMKSIPREIKNDIDQVYNSVYSWSNTWSDLNRARHDMYRLYYLLEDPHGLLCRICKLIKHFKPSFYALSYYKKYFDDDPANADHRLWLNPNNEHESSCESFYDLVDKAKERAFNMIQAAYEYVFMGSGFQNLTDVIGDVSYVTGMEAEDF